MRTAIGLLVLMLAAFPIFGQVPTLTVEVPFAFEVAGGRVLPAGTYQITQLHPLFAQVRNTIEPRHGLLYQAATWVVPSGMENEPRLVFNKYGDRHFLSQVWNVFNYAEVAKSRQERELVTSRMLAKAPGPQTVTVVARLTR